MTCDPFDERCRRCRAPLRLDLDVPYDDAWCSAACAAAGPRRSPLAVLRGWWRRATSRTNTLAEPNPDDDPLAWFADLRKVGRLDEDVVRDWLALHGIVLRHVADEPGVLTVHIADGGGAYLAVVLDDDPEPRCVPLVMAPPELAAAHEFRPLRRRDIAEGTSAP